jgi:2-C-methyl-D-erythritol 2,4-cyclodiphosphate synthase
MRIGHGYDVHGLVVGRKLILGGVLIPHEKGLQGHSDADVLIHAVCDACLGAAGLGDIGKHFPDTDAKFKNIDSRVLLKKVQQLLAEQALEIGNLDCTILAQAPKLAPYIEAMKANLAQDLSTDIGNVNVKATTTEKLGFVGQQQGMAAHAVVLLVAK